MAIKTNAKPRRSPKPPPKIAPYDPLLLNIADDQGRRLFRLDGPIISKADLERRLLTLEARTLTRWEGPQGEYTIKTYRFEKWKKGMDPAYKANGGHYTREGLTEKEALHVGPDPSPFIALGEKYLLDGGEPENFIVLAKGKFPGIVRAARPIEEHRVEWVEMEKHPGYYKVRGTPDTLMVEDPKRPGHWIKAGDHAAPHASKGKKGKYGGRALSKWEETAAENSLKAGRGSVLDTLKRMSSEGITITIPAFLLAHKG